jgi:hypothetical protein
MRVDILPGRPARSDTGPREALRAGPITASRWALRYPSDTQKNLREMLNPKYQFEPSGPPRAICVIVVPKASPKFNWNM